MFLAPSRFEGLVVVGDYVGAGDERMGDGEMGDRRMKMVCG
jgi:hypothetical protein